jgi:hypothetical protein
LPRVLRVEKGEDYGKTEVWSRGIFMGDPGRRAVPMAVTKADLDAAAEAWLDAQAGFREYMQATDELFRVFSEGWSGQRRGLTEAFDSFRQALVRESRFEHLEVAEVIPSHNSNSE